MIRKSINTIVPVLAIFVAGCQTHQQVAQAPTASPMDGQWASADGVFVASFRSGQFTSRFTKTNEVLADGRYSIEGSQVTMQWHSVATKQQRSASCTITSPNTVHCNQGGGTGFDLQRTA